MATGAIKKENLTSTTFSELGLSKQTVARLEQIGFEQPTKIQQQTISTIISGADLMASAETGSGKTAAYALPIMEQLEERPRGCVALVVVPTRELAIQVRAEFDRFMPRGKWRTAVLYGGCGYGKQMAELRKHPAIIVATPGRLLDLLDQKIASIANIQHLVLDEADRLMDLGFMPQVRRIVTRAPKARQTLMFSATFEPRVEGIAQEFLRNPVRVEVKGKTVEPHSIDQKFHMVKDGEKDKLLLEVVNAAGEGSVLVFTKTRRRAKLVAAGLRFANVGAKEIHGEISQNQRERTLEQYRKGQFNVLVATDVAARGLDIPAITHVINYDLPQSAPDYVHRIGRTGRAGRSGCSHTFVGFGDTAMLCQIERLIGRTLVERPKVVRMGNAPKGRRFAPRRSRA